MKNRTWLSYTLDWAGVSALGGAAAILGAALWMNGTPTEGGLLAGFKIALATAVSMLLLARLTDIKRLLRTAPEVEAMPDAATASNVENLPTRGDLPRAA